MEIKGVLYMARQCGLKNIYIALLTSDAGKGIPTVYGTPTKLERAIKATIKPTSTQTLLRSDDSVEDIVNFFESVAVSIELNQLSLTSRALLQGAKVVKGVLIETKDDIPPLLAFGFQSKKTNGKSRFVWLYKGSFSLNDDTYESEADKFKDQTASLDATFYSRDSDNAYRLIADEDEISMDMAFINAFFTAVCNQPSGTVVGSLTATSIAGTLSGSTKITVTPTITVGNSYVYKTAASIILPSLNDMCSVAAGYTTWAGTADITAVTGDQIEIVEVDSTFRAIKAGKTTVVAKA